MDVTKIDGLIDDTYIITSFAPFLASGPNPNLPYFKRISTAVLNRKCLDPNYQNKMKKLLLSHMIKSLSDYGYGLSVSMKPSLERSLDRIISSVNNIKTDNPFTYHEEHYAELRDDKDTDMIKTYAEILENAIKIISDIDSETALPRAKEAFIDSFENAYIPAFEFLMKILSSDNQKKDVCDIAEDILCLKRVMIIEGKTKSDVRHIRDLLSQPSSIHSDDSYHIVLSEEEMDIDVDELLKMTMMVGFKSLHLTYYCNMFMLLKMYEKAFSSGFGLIE